MKVLLVSDVHHFSTMDVFKGYVEGFEKLRIPFESVNMTDLIGGPICVNMDVAFGMVYAKFMNVENEFTHCLFISGLVVPEWFFKSKYGKKVGVIATDDPHASQVLLKTKEHIDYWFTNEKKMENIPEKIIYLPVATSQMLPTAPKSEIDAKHKYDFVFIGTIYDDRIKPLEQLCEYCNDNNYTCKIIGPLLKTPKNSIINKYATNGIISNTETKLLYRGAKVVVNIDRNVEWNPNEDEGNSLLMDVGKPYSSNPRVYEIAACRTPQLYVNPRQEVLDIFGDNIFYCNDDSVKAGLDAVLNTPVEVLTEKVNNCFQVVRKEHLYIHRVNKLINFLKGN